jgi:(1->4)-alpha-D-glucan 1-alpha-D-glucosylmutase
MLTSSTHDTKRSEDVRARISAISELPREWRAAVNRWTRMNRRHKIRVEGALAPDRNDEYHLYQTLVGVWPFGMRIPDADFIERITSYMVKAVREGQRHSSWINPGDDYESALTGFIEGMLRPDRRNRFLDDVADIAGRFARIGAFTSLSQQLLKLTAPGAPDIYQGTELWDFSLVDPDNRRPVDFASRQAMLTELKTRTPDKDLMTKLIDDLESGAIKLYLTSRALAFRAANPELFARGDYIPVDVTGPLENYIVAFRRSWNGSECIIVAPRLIGGLLRDPQDAPIGELWRGTRLCLSQLTGDTSYAEAFSGQVHRAAPGDIGFGIDLADVLAEFPVALLERA